MEPKSLVCKADHNIVYAFSAVCTEFIHTVKDDGWGNWTELVIGMFDIIWL